MKCCNHCKEIKPLEAFHRRISAKDGRRGECADCSAMVNMRRYRAAPVERVEAADPVLVGDAMRAWRGPVSKGALRWAA